MKPSQKTTHPNRQAIGELGEALVAHWLAAHGWVVCHQRWRCRWGELDLVAVPAPFNPVPAQSSPQPAAQSLPVESTLRSTSGSKLGSISGSTSDSASALIFIEVKTRNDRNWDADGALAISPQKQGRLWQAARAYVGRYPQYADAVCRFDVALVRCVAGNFGRGTGVEAGVEAGVGLDLGTIDWSVPSVQHGAIVIPGYSLAIIQYLEGALLEE